MCCKKKPMSWLSPLPHHLPWMLVGPALVSLIYGPAYAAFSLLILHNSGFEAMVSFELSAPMIQYYTVLINTLS